MVLILLRIIIYMCYFVNVGDRREDDYFRVRLIWLEGEFYFDYINVNFILGFFKKMLEDVWWLVWEL